MNRTFRTFWMIWCEDGGAPTFRHCTLESAKAEAARLATNHAGRRFYVMEAVEAVEKLEVAWIFGDPDGGNEVPF